MSDLKHLFEKNREWSSGIRKTQAPFEKALLTLDGPA